LSIISVARRSARGGANLRGEGLTLTATMSMRPISARRARRADRAVPLARCCVDSRMEVLTWRRRSVPSRQLDTDRTSMPSAARLRGAVGGDDFDIEGKQAARERARPPGSPPRAGLAPGAPPKCRVRSWIRGRASLPAVGQRAPRRSVRVAGLAGITPVMAYSLDAKSQAQRAVPQRRRFPAPHRTTGVTMSAIQVNRPLTTEHSEGPRERP